MKTIILKRNVKKMLYLLLPVIAGVAIIIQSALSSNVSREFGTVETILLVHLFGLIAAVIVYLFQGNTSFAFFSKVNLAVVISGALGVVIIFAITKSYINNGALPTVMISVMIQLLLAKLIDHFGLFGIEKAPISGIQVMALVLMISGVVLLQMDK